MADQLHCRLCPNSYKAVLEFMDHFETHMNQNEQIQRPTEDMPNIRPEDEDVLSQISVIDSDSLKNSKKERLVTQCKKCDKSFSKRSSLKVHIKTVHDKVKSYKCNSCSKAFGQKHNLKVHINTVHEKQTHINVEKVLDVRVICKNMLEQFMI